MESGTIVPDAAAAAPPPPPAVCTNCGAALSGPYCAQCGQRSGERLVSIRRILADTLEDQFSWNAGLPRTFGALLFHPGRLTTEYVAGRVAAYIPPMRLYLTASLLFFLLVSFKTNDTGVPGMVVADSIARPAGSRRAATAPAKVPAAATPAKAPATTTPAAKGAAAEKEGRGTVVLAGSSGTAKFSVDTAGSGDDGWFSRRLHQQALHIAAADKANPGQGIRIIVGGLLNTAPKVAFLLLPCFALLLKLLYVRRRRLYVEHFVFSLHVHAVAFLAISLAFLVDNGWLTTALLLGLTRYIYQAMRQVYGQGWFRTLLKFGFLFASYTLVLSLGAGLALVAALMTV